MTLRTPAFSDAKTYGFEYLRLMLELALQEGVLLPGDFKVTAAAAGGLRVDVAAGTALIKGDSGVPGTGLTQGLFIVINDASVPNAVTVPAAHASLPRIDQIILRVRDTADLGSSSDSAQLDVVAGAPTAGATLDNRTGASPLPADALRLADVLIPAAGTAVTAGNLRDRRPWARGAYRRIVRNANASGTNDYSIASATPTAVDAVNLAPRVECSGSALRMTLTGLIAATTAAVSVGLRIDGQVVDGGIRHDGNPSGNAPVALTWHAQPAAGSRLVAPFFQMPFGGSALLFARPDLPLLFTVEELFRSSTDNT